MEIDELKTAWAELESRTDAVAARERAVHRHGLLDGMRARLRIAGAGLVVQVAAGAALALLGGSFWFSHWGQTHLVLPGMAVHLYGLLVVGFAVTQLVAWRRIDFGRAVLEVRQQVARLRLLRARSERALLVVGMILWTPACMMLLKTIGVDLWRVSPAYVWANLVVGFFLAAALAWAMRRWPHAFEDLGVGGGLRHAEQVLADPDQ